jgi:NADPH:quinone reductase-like Zn-dependent oxidoreductase
MEVRALSLQIAIESTNFSAASSITAQVAIQLAKRSGMRIVAVASKEKHGQLLESLGAGKPITFSTARILANLSRRDH